MGKTVTTVPIGMSCSRPFFYILPDDIKFLVRQGWSNTDLHKLGCQEDVDQVILKARARSSFSLDFMKRYHYIVFDFDRTISVVEGFLCQPDWSLDQLIKQYETHFTSFSTSHDDFLNVILGGKSITVISARATFRTSSGDSCDLTTRT